MKPSLTIDFLQEEARNFAQLESTSDEEYLYGVTDGKAVGTYLEHKFQEYLHTKYNYSPGSSAKGIDFPSLNVDMKVTSTKQPQSSCPFKSARQKVYGLGYSLIIFIYDKIDNNGQNTSRLNILDVIFVRAEQTGDYQTTVGIRRILDNNGNMDDILAFFDERMLPLDEIQAQQLAKEILRNPPDIGYLTISNALQWRLQYRRVIGEAGKVPGIMRIL